MRLPYVDSDRRGLITKPNDIGWGPADWANYCQDPAQEPEEEQTVQRRKLELAPQSKTGALTWETELVMGPEMTEYHYCYIELPQEEPSEFQGIHGKAPFRTSLNINFWDEEFQDCSHQQLPHHPQCECPDCNHISWGTPTAPGRRNPLEIASEHITPWDQRIMKLAGLLIPCAGRHYPTVQWNTTVATQALDKYNNH